MHIPAVFVYTAGKMVLRRNISFPVYIALRNYSLRREARKLDKLIRKGEQRSEKSHLPKSTSMSEYAQRVLYSPATKRLAALNSVFMELVCDITSSGKHSGELNRLGIHILKAKVSPNLSLLFLYWIHTKPIVEEELDNFLPQVASDIRFELSTLKVMGRVPEVRFVRDKEFFEAEMLEKIFDEIKLTSSTIEKLNDNETEELGESEGNKAHVNAYSSLSFDQVLSKQQQNVYGLDYPKILDNIMKQKTKRESNPLERKTVSCMSTDDEKPRLDKKALSKVIFKEAYQLRKMRLKNKELNIINDKNYEGDADETENYQNYEEYETYDENYVDEEMRKILERDSCQGEDPQRETK